MPKSLLTIAFFASLLTVPAFAQTPELSTAAPYAAQPAKRAINITPTAYLGAGMLNTTGDSGMGNYTKLPGMSYGLGVLTNFGGDSFGFATGLRYLRQSGVLQRTEIQENWSSSYKLTLAVETIGIPLLAKFRTTPTGSGSRFSFIVGAEPVYAFGATVDAKASATYKGQTQERNYNGWTKDGLRAVNVHGVAGIGLEIMTAGGKALLGELTYNRTLLPYNHDDEKAKNYLESFLLSAGLTL